MSASSHPYSVVPAERVSGLPSCPAFSRLSVGLQRGRHVPEHRFFVSTVRILADKSTVRNPYLWFDSRRKANRPLSIRERSVADWNTASDSRHREHQTQITRIQPDIVKATACPVPEIHDVTVPAGSRSMIFGIAVAFGCYPTRSANRSMSLRIMSRLERQNSTERRSMPKSAANVAASARPVEDSSRS